MTDQSIDTLVNAQPIILILLIILASILVLGVLFFVLRPVLSGRGAKTQAEAEAEKVQANTLKLMGEMLKKAGEDSDKRIEVHNKQLEALNTMAQSMTQLTKSQVAARSADEKKTGEIITNLSNIQLTLSHNYEALRDANAAMEEEITKRFNDLPGLVKTPIVDDLSKITELVSTLKIMLAEHDVQRIESVKNIIDTVMAKLAIMHDDIIIIMNRSIVKEGD